MVLQAVLYCFVCTVLLRLYCTAFSVITVPILRIACVLPARGGCTTTCSTSSCFQLCECKAFNCSRRWTGYDRWYEWECAYTFCEWLHWQ